MKPIIGFAGTGHLMEHAAASAHIKGFKRTTYAPCKTGDSLDDLRQCDIVYICPDRPGIISPDKMVDLILPYLKSTAILVIHCQVHPGFTRMIKWSNVYYHVETLRMKDAMERALNPDRIIIGSIDGAIDGLLLQYLRSYNCPILPMSYESAELTKIAINIYLAAQVSTTNTLFEIAEKIGADWNDIIPALQSDARIGMEAYLQPGFGLSQHLERDLREIQGMNINTSVTDAFLDHSEYRRSMS